MPWGHNLVLLSRLKHPKERLVYAQSAILHGWSRNMLNIHIETRLLERIWGRYGPWIQQVLWEKQMTQKPFSADQIDQDDVPF